MYLYNSLRNLALVFGWLRGEFNDAGEATRSVWLVGQYISGWFYAFANICGSLDGATREIAGDWLDFYRWVTDNISVDNTLNLLLRYADDLISFIRDPFDWIADTIRDIFPELLQIARDPIAWVLETITRYTGISWDFLDSPLNWVQDRIRELAGDVIEIARDPRQWLMDWLADIIPDWWDFIYDARFWVRKKIEQEFPDLIHFLNDPDGFLEDRLVLFIDRLADKYLGRTIKLVERILNAIF